MHPQTIFTKTAKGVLEVENRTIRLPRDLGLLFLAVDGRRPVSELPQKTGMDESSLVQALDRLVADGYIRVLYEPPDAGHASSTSADLDLDFTSPATTVPTTGPTNTPHSPADSWLGMWVKEIFLRNIK